MMIISLVKEIVLSINSIESNLYNFFYLSSEKLEEKIRNFLRKSSRLSILKRKDFTLLIVHP